MSLSWLVGTAQAEVVISQVYGGGGNSGAPVKSDYIELHNNGATAVSVDGWSVQYASSTGTSWSTTPLTGSIPAGAYYLVKQAEGAGAQTDPVAFDAIGSIAMSSGSGKVALASSTTALSGVCPTGGAVDFVGYGSANCFEGTAAAPGLSSTTADFRADDGCTDSNVNSSDFSTSAPSARNSASPTRLCGPAGPAAFSISDASAAEGDSSNTPLFFTIRLNQPAPEGGVSIDYATADDTATTADDDYLAKAGNAMIAEGQTSVSISIDIVGDTTTEPDERLVINLSNPVNGTIADGQGAGTIVNDDIVTVSIHDIQGTGAMSPLVGQSVYTLGIVTGVRSAGFYIQNADADVDADPATSEGVYVYTGSTPPAAAAVGNRVQVAGAVAEYIPAADPGQLPLTEIVAPTVVSLSIGNPLPTPVSLSTALPHPGGALDQLERFEGMRVTAPSFTVVAPTRGFTNEPNATGTSNGVFNVVVTGTPRPFREAGIQAPDPAPGSGAIPPIPRWDFNPELLTVVSAGLGAPVLDLAAGTTIQNLVGPLDYSFRRYTILPDPGATPLIGGAIVPTPSRVAMPDEFTVASYNVERFFDTINDPNVGEPVLATEAFARRLNKLSLGIRDYLNTPDIIGVMEVENLSTLESVADTVNADAMANGQADPRYVAYLEEGNDVGGIDVGFLVKTGEVAAGVSRVETIAVTQFGKDETWVEPAGGTSLLNDRPPLALDAVVHYFDGRQFPITVIVVHQRSLGGADGDDANGARVRAKRQRQAEFVAQLVQGMQDADPGRHIVVLGDFNAFEFNDGLTDVLGTMTGLPSPDETTVVPGDGGDLVQPDLLNLYIEEPDDQRYTFVFGGNAQSLDHVLINQALGVRVSAFSLDHARINADFPEIERNIASSPTRLSDHDPAIAYFQVVSPAVADLVVTAMTSTPSIGVGQPMQFAASVRNDGPDDAEYAGVGFALDAELPDLAVASPVGWSCDAPTIDAGTTSVACAVSSLAAGSSADFALSARAPAQREGASVSLSVSATSLAFDPDMGNNTAGSAIQVTARADLSVAWLQGDAPATNGGPYRAVVMNLGPSPAIAPLVSIETNMDWKLTRVIAPPGWTCLRALPFPYRSFRTTCSTGGELASAAEAVFDVHTAESTLRRIKLIQLRVEAVSSSEDPDVSNNVDLVRRRYFGVSAP